MNRLHFKQLAKRLIFTAIATYKFDIGKELTVLIASKLDDQLPLHVRVEEPRAGLMEEVVQLSCLRQISGLNNTCNTEDTS